MATRGRHGFRNTQYRGLTPGAGPESVYLPRRYTYAGQFTGTGPNFGFGPLVSGESFVGGGVPPVGYTMNMVYPAVVLNWTAAIFGFTGFGVYKFGVRLSATSSVGILNGDFTYVSPLMEWPDDANMLHSFDCPWTGMSGIGIVLLAQKMELNLTPTIYGDEP